MEEVEITQTIPLKDSTPNKMLSPRKLGQDSRDIGSPKSPGDKDTLTSMVGILQSDKENHHSPKPDASHISTFDADDTCMSNFSMVQTIDVTRLAHSSSTESKQSPLKSPSKSIARSIPSPSHATPRSARNSAKDREASPTPKRSRLNRSDDTTTQLLDFTEQLSYAGSHSPSASRRVAAYRSPTKNNNANLLDFDLPPAPTPRSLPTITARELESLKAGFVSQISSLKATIDGKDATIKSLIDAKDDAERRVGETSEKLRDAQDSNKALQGEKTDWEKRDTEVTNLLREVKNELLDREKERDELSLRLAESEKHIEDAATRTFEADTKASEGQFQVPQVSVDTTGAFSFMKDYPQEALAQFERGMATVTQDLHERYKTKHQIKVKGLKKSYERRWTKAIRDLEDKIETLKQENEDLRVDRDSTMSSLVPSMKSRGIGVDASTCVSPSHASSALESNSSATNDDAVAADAQVHAEIDEFAAGQLGELREQAKISEERSRRVEVEIGILRAELERSRSENSDLVAVVEEMLQLEPAAISPSEMLEGNAPKRSTSQIRSRSNSVSEAFRASGSEHSAPTKATVKTSGLAKSGFGFGTTKIGSLNRSMSGGQGSRSGVMSNIEKMGRGRAAE